MNELYKNKRNLLAAAVASGILYVTSQFVIMKILEPLGSANIFRFQLSFDIESIAALLGAWGPAGIDTFRTHFYLDFIHPVLYGSFLFFSMLYLKTGLSGTIPTGGIPIYCYIPFIGAALDLVENVLELTILSQNPDFSAGLVFATALISLSKWVLAAVSIGIILVMGARLVLKTITSGSRAS